MASCPICGGASSRALEVYDDRYGYPGTFRIYRCVDCGHRHLEGADFSDAQIGALYSHYYPRRNMRPEDWRPEEERAGLGAWLDGACASAFRWVPRDVKVLDIGCGFGQALRYHESRGCEAWGVESDENVLPVAELQGLNLRIGVFRAEDYPQEYFDIVTMDQVIEHARDPVATLASARKVMKPGGAALLSTPNASGWGARVFGARWINWHAPYHLHFFTTRSMNFAAERAGLAAEPLGTLTSSEWLYYQWLHIAGRPTPGRPAAFWTGGAPAGGTGRALQRLASVLHRAKVNHLLTRLFDGLGLGDSQLFRLRRA